MKSLRAVCALHAVCLPSGSRTAARSSLSEQPQALLRQHGEARHMLGAINLN